MWILLFLNCVYLNRSRANMVKAAKHVEKDESVKQQGQNKCFIYLIIISTYNLTKDSVDYFWQTQICFSVPKAIFCFKFSNNSNITSKTNNGMLCHKLVLLKHIISAANYQFCSKQLPAINDPISVIWCKMKILNI